MTTKHQTTVPKAARERLGLKAGDQLEWTPAEGGGMLVKRKVDRKRMERWIGHIKDPDLVGRDPVEIIREMRGE